MLRLLISGALGHMGRTVAELAAQSPDITLIGGIDPRADGGQDGFPLFADFASVTAQADAVIDFSHPSALELLLAFAAQRKVPVVLATTGYTPEQQARITAASHDVAIFQSANMSYGVNVLVQLAEAAAAALGDAFDVEIVEKHHRRKIDAPSGTALMLAKAIAAAYPEQRRFVTDRPARHQARDVREIGIVAVRGGTVPGEHEIGFYGEDEVITLTHAAQSRRLFAAGALRAARYVAGRQPGLYNMQQLLLEQSLVTHVGVERNVAMVSVHDVPCDDTATLFARLANINIDMISQSAPVDGKVQVAFSLPEAALAQATQAVGAAGATWPQAQAATGLVKLTVSGEGMAHASGVASRVFTCLDQAGIAVRLITTSETKIGLCVAAAQEQAAVSAIRAAFHI